jgi:hypothetical protein
MRSFPKITFIVDDFAVGSPAQQLLDRFLIGYNRDGQFYTAGCQVELLARKRDDNAVVARAKDFGLKVTKDTTQAESIVIFGSPNEHIEKLPRGARCFIYGPLAQDGAEAEKLVTATKERGITVRAGTAVLGAFQLPALKTPERARRKLAVTHGRFPEADLEAVEALWSMTQEAAEQPKVRLLTRGSVWALAYSPEWSGLFAAAFSRSNTIQGDPVKDGRTQDVAGLRLVEKLVSEPRAWLIDSDSDESKTAVFVMNGALEDLNAAFQDARGKMVSTQLYQPPTPMQGHFSNLAAQIEDFFRQESAVAPGPALMRLPAVFQAMRDAMRESGLRGSATRALSR